MAACGVCTPSLVVQTPCVVSCSRSAVWDQVAIMCLGSVHRGLMLFCLTRVCWHKSRCCWCLDTGLMSKFLGDLKAGDAVAFKGPIPKYPYKANSKKEIGMIAGGKQVQEEHQHQHQHHVSIRLYQHFVLQAQGWAGGCSPAQHCQLMQLLQWQLSIQFLHWGQHGVVSVLLLLLLLCLLLLSQAQASPQCSRWDCCADVPLCCSHQTLAL